MKNTVLLFVALVSLTCPAVLVAQQQPSNTGGHLGTWQMVSSKNGDAKDFSDYPKDRRHVKMITATHFIWVDYGTDAKKIESAAGGPYELNGNAYTETIEFAGEGMESYLGKKQVFTIKIDGNKLYQSGTLSDGFKIDEVWQRIK